MQDLYVKIHEYLNMDEEIPYEEFDAFYKKVINYLNEHSESLNEEQIWKGLFMVENILSNAESRSKEKGPKAKKYSKIKDRASLWAQNLAARLYQLGYQEEQLNERFEKMFDDGIVNQ